MLDVHATFETEDGALIYTHYSGLADAGPDGYERFLADDFPTKLPLKAKALPVGADFLLLRKDGICVLDVHATFETEDGALIYTHYSGLADAGPDGYERFLADDFPTKLPLRNAPRFAVFQCFGVGEADLAKSLVSYDVFAAL